MMRTMLFAATACALLAASPAVAQELPNYDVDAYCAEIGRISGGSAQIRNACIRQEQAAYDGLRARWPSLPARVRRYCDEIGRISGGTFQILQACVQQETAAEQQAPTFRR